MNRHKRVQIKLSARDNLLGHYSSVIAALLIDLLAIMLLNVPFTNMITQGYYFGAYGRIAVGIVGLIVVMLVCFLLFYGVFWINLQIARGQKTNFTDMIYPFKNRPVRFFGFNLLMMITMFACIFPGIICIVVSGVRQFELGSFDISTVGRPILMAAGTLALIAGAIVLFRIIQSWMMTFFLLLDHPEFTTMQAIRQSRRMMHKKRWRLFVLYLSFLGWLLFSVLTLFIGLLWLVPYILQSITCFYLDLCEEAGTENGFSQTEGEAQFNADQA